MEGNKTTIELLPNEFCGTKTINDLLPNEILIKIFEYLICTDNWNVALTCKLWRELAGDLCLGCVTLKFSNFHRPDPAKLDVLRTTNRKFCTIKLYGDLTNLEMDDVEIFQRLGPKVVKLIWIGNRCANITKFSQILHCLPNVEHISVFNSTVDHYNDDLPDLRNLQSLELSDCRGNISDVFRRAELKMLTIELHSRIPEDLRTFLWSQKDMQRRSRLWRSFVISTDDLREEDVRLSFSELSALQLKLTKFSATVDHRSDGVNSILQANMETLTDLDLNGHLLDSTFELIFTMLKKLKSLKLRVSRVPRDIDFYKMLDVSHIKSLTLIDPPAYCEHFFMRLPHLKKLTLLRCRKEFLKLISDKLKNLTSLSLDSDDQLTTDRITIPSMTTLHIRNQSHRVDWDEFTKDNHQLTELIIDNVERREFLNILDMECITQNTSLRTLRIEKGLTATEDMLMVIRCNSPLLEVLILGSENF